MPPIRVAFCQRGAGSERRAFVGILVHHRLGPVRRQGERRQIREMADRDIPLATAIDLVDQWVAAGVVA